MQCLQCKGFEFGGGGKVSRVPGSDEEARKGIE